MPKMTKPRLIAFVPRLPERHGQFFAFAFSVVRLWHDATIADDCAPLSGSIASAELPVQRHAENGKVSHVYGCDEPRLDGSLREVERSLPLAKRMRVVMRKAGEENGSPSRCSDVLRRLGGLGLEAVYATVQGGERRMTMVDAVAMVDQAESHWLTCKGGAS
jgi:hypothetical protein